MFVLVVAVVGPAGTVTAGISFNVALFFSLTTFVVDDFSPFVVHRMSHSIPILWELHKVLLQAAPPISVLHRQSIPKQEPGKLVSIIPKPRSHLVCYHRVFTPNTRLRKQVGQGTKI